MEVSNEAYVALINYFKGLKHLGYRSYKEVYQLLALLFIEEILYGPMSEFITDSDYKSIVDAMYCLYGTCLIPYPSYLKGREGINKKTLDSFTFRITETDILRGIEESLRTLA